MDLELRLREAVMMQDPGEAFTARIMGNLPGAAVIDIRTRRRRRKVLAGVMIVIGAAAAMLALRPSNPPVPFAAEGARQPVMQGRQPVMQERLVVDEQVAATGMSTMEPGEARASSEASGRITVLVMPLGEQPEEPLARGALEAFRAVLVQELRRMPDLVLMDAGDAAGAAAAMADYRLVTTTMKREKFPSGLAGVDASQRQVEARILVARDAGPKLMKGKDYYIRPHVGSDGAPGARSVCGYGGSLRRVRVGDTLLREQPCKSVASIAGVLADVIRQQKTDPLVLQRQLVAQLEEASWSESQRLLALKELAGAMDEQLDASAIGAIVEYIRSLSSTQRRQAWRDLRGRKELELVQPMLDALRNDADEQVRLAVLQILMSAHGGDRKIMAELEAVVRDDPSEIVRTAVRRTRHGDSELNTQVLSALRNSGLANRERLQPLMVARNTASNAAQLDALANALYDEKAVNLVVSALRESNPNDLAQHEMIIAAVQLFGRVDRPEAMGLLIELTRGDTRGNAADFLLAFESMRSLVARRDDPRARAAVEQAMAGNADLRMLFERQLAQPPAGQ